ncbi:protein Gawky-like [Amphibalanus amphitrite]|uniref:protein Gawky-like n=2 Tax=Amphibalanus amphitrite TaxID=1232801 RepID=UPI001C912FE8|nr:protein Gawky-like [Amphibalanus amphitrite]
MDTVLSGGPDNMLCRCCQSSPVEGTEAAVSSDSAFGVTPNTKDTHNISMVHCNNSGQSVNPVAVDRSHPPVAPVARSTALQCEPGSDAGVPSESTLPRRTASSTGATETMGDAAPSAAVTTTTTTAVTTAPAASTDSHPEYDGVGVSAPTVPGPSGAPARAGPLPPVIPPPSMSATDPSTVPAKLSPSAAAAALATLQRVPPRGPASTAGWRLPRWARLAGGGESTGNNGTGGWGAPPPAAATAAAGTTNWGQPGPPPGQWGGAGRPTGAAPPPAGAAPPPPGAAGGAAKNGAVPESAGGVPQPQPGATAGQRTAQTAAEGSSSGSNGSGGGGSAVSPAAPAAPQGGGADTSDLERLKAMRAAITATEGWSSSQVNQDSVWDMPASPEPADKEPPGTMVAWKLPGVNNGLEVWQMSTRNGGAPPVKPPETQWPHHIPQSNIGGTWGEDDDSQPGGMWTGAPAGPPTGQWGGATGGGGGGGGGAAALWAAGARKDDWGGGKPWDARGPAPNGDGWGSKPPSQWGGPPQHGPGQWGDERSPPMARRSMGFDDWGNKRGGGGGGWKDAGPVRPVLPGGPPAPLHMLSRMPPDHKGVDPWGRPPRGGWGEPAPGPAGWGAEEKWGGDGPGGWGKPKTPTTPVMPGAWGEPEMDWAAKGRGPAGGMGHAKNPMYDKARMGDHGFKHDDVDPMMRNNMMLTLEDAVDQLRMGGGAGGAGGPGGPAGDWRTPDHPPFEPAGFSQMPPPHAPYGGVQLPAAGAPAAGNINPAVVQQLLRQQAQGGQPSRFPGQPPQPSPQQLRPLINQIQMAVHAGHLNPAILQQPMAPQTLVLLNHLLSQIKHLDQLSRQVHLARGHPNNSPHLHSLQMEMMRIKNNISNIQAQISSQQTMLLKQQQQPPPAPAPMAAAAAGGGQLLYKGPGGGGAPDLHGLPANLGELSIRDGGVAAGHMPQSRLSQWKLPTADKLLRGDEDFSRAPGSASKAGGSPPMTLMAESAWSASRGGRDGGWPDGSAGRGGGAPSTPASDRQDSKDGWPESAGGAGGHSYADLVPEFEPGKPWKMKSADDDPTLTPGAAARSPLGLAGAAGSSQDLLAMQTGKASPTATTADGFGSSTWSFNPNGGKPGMSAGGGGGGADWGVKSRGPPPGLNKTGGWGGGQAGGALGRPGGPYDQRSAFAQVQGGSYSGGGGGGSAWLLLRNLTAQIDGSTLKTLCMQHGPLYTFHMYLSQGVALVKYSSREEAAKAQGALNNCVLSNTTILAEAVSDEAAGQVLQQLGLPGGGGGGGQPPSNPASSTASQGAATGGQSGSKPPASAAWSDMTDAIGGGGASMAWSSSSAAGNSSLWAASGGLEEPGRGPFLPDGLL